MTARPTRVAVADDEPLVRAGVRAILASAPHIEVVAEASDGHEAIELVRLHQIDVLLLDIEMPRGDGIAVTEEIRRIGADVRVLVLTTFGTGENLHRCLAAGANGFLLKATAPAELIAGVDAVTDGGAVIAPRVAHHLVDSLRDISAHRHDPRVAALSARETDVLRLLSQGRSNVEIAAALHLTEGTVKGYVSGILQTLGVNNRVQAALIGYQAGLTREQT
ncbi:response regulator [Streptomyces sp. 3MP-14]|uniref:Response regulator n=1 Tax=Streptomyces mimosae TaxID=2586635 RepID=A0A5N6AMJ4_9ACTN|nr:MULTISPECIES: response regulator transcription factor [Streptomyces]KAB8169854.1 response regulator [Streptomyces mimosae]KAB8178602.1 response regulator [Streptomyces sp. 3MP-14]